MTQETYNLIVGALQINLNEWTASYLYYKHQLSLPEKHRIDHNIDEWFEGNMNSLRIGIESTNIAIEDLKLNKNKYLDGPQGN